MSHFLANLAEEPLNVYTEYVAARTIQKYCRGYITRKYIKYLHENAIVIQRNWRGALGRKRFNQIIKEKLDTMHRNYYNKAATTIQKLFRGYHVRKYVFSYYEMKKKINRIGKQNVELLNRIEEFKKECMKEKEQELDKVSEELVQCMIFKLHHLLRTNQIEGIYSLKNTKEYSCIEKMMKKIKFKDYMKNSHIKSEAKSFDPTQHNYLFKGILKKCEEEWIRSNDPGKQNIFGTDVYGDDEELNGVAEKYINYIKSIQNGPEYSCIEKMVKKMKCKDDMKNNHIKSEGESFEPTEHNYIFKGSWKKCEKAWLHRNDPGKHSIFCTGVYGEDEELRAEAEQFINNFKCIQDEPMNFGKVQCKDDIKDTLDWKEHKCIHKNKTKKC